MPGLTRRSALRLAAGAGLSAALAGCGLVPSTRGARSAAPLTLLADATFVPAAQALVQAYAAEAGAAGAPLVEVASPSLPGAVQQILAGSSQAAPDLLWVTPAVRDLPEAPSLMLSLSPALGQTSIAAGLYPACLAYGASGLRQLALPVFRDPLVTFYNGDALARAGLNPPVADWTLEACTMLCQALHAQPHGLLAPLANATNHFDLELFCAFVVGFGGQLLQPGRVGYTPHFASAAGAEGCGALAAWHAYEPPSPAGDPRSLFAAGQVALYFGHHRDVAPLAAQIGGLFAWDVAPLPRFPARAAQPVTADGLAAATTIPQRRAAAITLALFAGTAAAQGAISRTGVGVPAQVSLGSAASWRSGGPQIHDEVFVEGSAADVVVDLPLLLVAPVIRSALQAIVAGSPAYTTLLEAATYAQYQLATWQD